MSEYNPDQSMLRPIVPLPSIGSTSSTPSTPPTPYTISTDSIHSKLSTPTTPPSSPLREKRAKAIPANSSRWDNLFGPSTSLGKDEADADAVDDKVFGNPDFLDNDELELPTYKPKRVVRQERDNLYYVSPLPEPLMVLDIVLALRKNHRRARLIIWEIARREEKIKAFVMRSGFRLKGAQRDLDTDLGRMSDEMKPQANLGREPSNPKALNQAMETHDKILKDVSWQEEFSSAKGSLLRLDKYFRDIVISVLKNSMATKEVPNYVVLKQEAGNVHTEALAICGKLRLKYDTLFRLLGAEQNSYSRQFELFGQR